MIQRMLTSALIAGFAAGLLAAFLHFAFVQNLILLGEKYETGEAVHFQGVASAPDEIAAGAGLSETAGSTAVSVEETNQSHVDADGAEPHHHDEEAEVSTLMRNGLTVGFSAVMYIAYALLLVAGFGLLTVMGRKISLVEGVLWGIGGFAAFQMFPAIGLAPELPGTLGAEVGARQIWWWSTALASATGIGLLAYGNSVGFWLVGIVLLAAPHVIGAPHLNGFAGVAPPEVAGEFSARVLGVGLVVWAVLGGTAGWLWARPEKMA